MDKKRGRSDGYGLLKKLWASQFFSILWLLHLFMPNCSPHLLVAWHFHFFVSRGSSSWSSNVEDGRRKDSIINWLSIPFSIRWTSFSHVRKWFCLYDGHWTFSHCKEIPNRHSQSIKIRCSWSEAKRQFGSSADVEHESLEILCTVLWV